jgi:DNA (cytosine-5)-methyltransferase 1
MRHGSLFNGIGGFQLAAEWIGWENYMSVEIDEFCSAITKKHYPNCLQYEDIQDTDFTLFTNFVDVLSGGFPCTDISVSGKGAGIEGSKSGLWSEYKRAIEEIYPKYALIENSPNLLKKGFEKVLYDLSEIGYDAEWECISASDIGACHKRERIWILAYPTIQRRRGILRSVKRSIIETDRHQANSLDSSCNPFLQFEQGFGEPPIFRMDDGLSKRLDVIKRLGACGNALMPQIPYQIFKAIEQYEKSIL